MAVNPACLVPADPKDGPLDVLPGASRRGRQRVGLLGGSFDPVHRAHIALALTALRELALDEVHLIPAADPWQRPKLAAAGTQRLHMLQLAVQGCSNSGCHSGCNASRLVINPMEIERGGASHTLTTLQTLPVGPDYYWLLGSDQLNNFCTWYRWQDIARLARLVVAQRPGIPLQAPAALLKCLDCLQRPLMTLPFAPQDLSATAIRQRLAGNDDSTLHDMIDIRVLQYIREQGLYRTPDQCPSALPPPAPAL